MSRCNVTLEPGASIMDHADAGVVCLKEGVYRGGLFLEKSVEIRGVPGSVIDADGKGAAVRLGTDDVVAVLSDVEIRGGHGELGAGVRLDGYADLTLRNCVIVGNKATQGGAGLGASRGTLRIEGGRVEGGALLTGTVVATLTSPAIDGGLRVREGAVVAVAGGSIGGAVDVAGTSTRAPKLVLSGTKLSDPVANDEEYPGDVTGP